ncbi:hypothetical protein Fmac_028319 [Flemingia macrophylla]|uniref:Uncharacterized protein n=1 Tax=Flemingia macrophylla TaxID=520843 RepID=A0ABD1L756_9FABA
MGLEDNSIEFCLQVPKSDRNIKNLEDYVDAAEYEALLQTLAESDSEGRKGAPPASKSVVQGLPTVKIESKGAVCTDALRQSPRSYKPLLLSNEILDKENLRKPCNCNRFS